MIDVIKDENITKHSELFEKSIKKELSRYLIKKAIKDGLINEKTGNSIIKNI